MWYGIYKEASTNFKDLSEEQVMQIAIDYEQGMSRRDVCKKNNIGTTVFETALALFDMKKRTPGGNNWRYSPSARKMIADDAALGLSEKELCLKYELDPKTLHRILTPFNIGKLQKTNPYRINGIEERIVELYHVLKNKSEVAKELGIGESLVNNVLKERNEPILHKTKDRRPKATEEQYLEISHRYESGEGYPKLANEYGVNQSDLKRRLIEEGVFDFERRWQPRQLSDEQLDEAARMTERMLLQDVAKHFRIHPKTLRLLLDEKLVPHFNNEVLKDLKRERTSEGVALVPHSEYEKIYNLNVNEGVSTFDLAKMYDTGNANITRIVTKVRKEKAQQVPVQASFNLRRLINASYSNEIGYLNRYLKEGFDPNDYEFELKMYLENQGQEFDEDLEYYDIAQEWLGKASKEDLEKFKKWVQNRPPSDMRDSPAYEAMSYNSFVKPTWLVHFTDDPYSIAKEGFKYGHEDTHGLALTTWYTNEARKRHAGYNFAFKVGSRDARICARQNKYGKHAVVFWGAGVEAYHSGDEEDQIIIWGPSVNTNLIFPVLNEEGSWVVNDWRNDKLLIKDDDFNKVAEWVVNNNQMLQQIRNKKT